MRVLNVNMAINSSVGGGSAERTFQMSRYLSKIGIECSILTLDIGLTKDIMQMLNNIKVISIPCINQRFFLPSFSTNSLRKIKNAIAEADVIHLMGHWSIINAIAYIFARHLKKPYVFCPAGTLIIHGRSKNFKKLYNRIIGKRIIRDAQFHIASTKDEISIMRENGINDNICVIPNGIAHEEITINEETEGVEFRSKYGLDKHPYILFVGTISSIKGPDLLLEAFCRVKNLFPSHHLVFAGKDRGMLEYLEAYVIQNKLKNRVHFIGHISGLEKTSAYCQADLLVVPSRSEVISMVALEAGISGTPVLMTDQCGFEQLKDASGVMIVSPSTEGIEKGLKKLFSGSPDQLKLMGKDFRNYVLENFSWDSIVPKYSELFNRILKGVHLKK